MTPLDGRGMTLGEVLRRLASWARRRRLETDLDEELAGHLEARTQELLDAGAARADAERLARVQLGNLTRIREDARSAWGFPSLESFLQDVRLGVRLLARHRGLTLVAVVSLAIGLGTAAAVFGLADAVLLRKLPVPEPDRLVLLRWRSTGAFPFESLSGVGSIDGNEASSTSFSLEAFETVRKRAGHLMDTVGFADLDRVGVTADGRAESLYAQVVSGNYFGVLGVRPALGRAIDAGDDRPGAPPVAMVSYTWWQSRFGGADDVVGRTIRVNDLPFTVVGVAPRGFTGTLQVGQDPEVTLPLAAYGPVTRTEDAARPGVWWVLMMGRLRPGVAPPDVEPLVTGVVGQLTSASRRDAPSPRVTAESAARGQREERDRMRESLEPMALVVAVVVLVACVNVASLLLARGHARSREVAVRAALGAPRPRIVRQLLTEGLLLALLAAVAGLGVARLAGRALAPALLESPGNATSVEATFDARVVLFTLLLSVACCLLFALVPAFRATRPGDALRGAGPGTSAVGTPRLGRALVVLQVALAVTLLSAAALLAGTVRNLVRVDPGFDPRGVLVFTVDPSQNGQVPDEARRTLERMRDRVAALPGVSAASFASHRLIANSSDLRVVTRPDEVRPARGTPEAGLFTEAHRARALEVHEDFLDALRIPLRRGRGLTRLDADGAARVVVVNEALARQLHGTTDVVGRLLRFGLADDPPVEIVGVAADVRYTSLRDEPPATAYVPWRQAGRTRVTFAVRAAGDPVALAPSVRAALREVDPDVPVVNLRTQESQIAASLTRERLFAGLATALAAVTLALCAIGVFGLLAYTVNRRTRELGIRLALGAPGAQMRWMVIRQAVALTALGAVLGIPAAVFASRLLDTLLFGLGPGDPVMVAGACLALLGAAVAAAWLPARRAAAVDPLVALRAE